MKIPKQQGSKSFWVDKHLQVTDGRRGGPRQATEAPRPLFLHIFALCLSSNWGCFRVEASIISR